MQISLTDEPGAPAASFLQSAFWAEFKTVNSWRPLRFTVKESSLDISFALSVLIRNVSFGFSIAYIPHGPQVAIQSSRQQEMLVLLAKALRQKLPAGVFCIRFDPAWYLAEKIPKAETESASEPLLESPMTESRKIDRPVYENPLRKSSDVQPPDSVIIDISKPDDELLAAMKPKWRYNIRLAAKKNVVIESLDSTRDFTNAIDTFYSLYEKTAQRDRIALHPKSYYARLFEMAGNAKSTTGSAEPIPDIRVWTALHEGQALAAIITIFYGTAATYLYGASSDEKRNLMPAYALQWEAMKAAREAGCSSYDLYGIPPSEDPGHAMAGLYRFKTGFGGEIRHYPGCWDIPVRPIVYAGFRLIEQARLYWHKSIQKRIRREGKLHKT